MPTAGGGGSAPASRPSRPAAARAAGSRYGFAAESASLISNRRSSGTLTNADRLLPLHVAAAGDHVEPELVPDAFRRL